MRLGKSHRLCVWVHSKLPWQRDREGQETPLFLIPPFSLLVLVLELRIESSALYIRGKLGKHCMAGSPGLNSKFPCLSTPSAWVTNMHHGTSSTLEWQYKVLSPDDLAVRETCLWGQDTGTEINKNKRWERGRKPTSTALIHTQSQT